MDRFDEWLANCPISFRQLNDYGDTITYSFNVWELEEEE
jgi:hypothetical protein